jgi:hypothetical protein
MGVFGIFYGNFVRFMAIWYILWLSGMVYLVYVAHFGIFGPIKIWQPWSDHRFN